MHEKDWEQAWTHQLWSTGLQRQIDFILVDDVRKEDSIGYEIISELDGKSDHPGLAADFRIAEWKAQRPRRARIQKGWKPRLDEHNQPRAYHNALDGARPSLRFVSECGRRHC